MSRCLRDKLLLYGSIATVAVLAACGGHTVETPPTSPRPPGTLAHDRELQLGRRVFAANCAECHGFTGGGGLGPTFNDGRLLQDFSDTASQVAFVKQGRGVMPAFASRLSDAELEAVVRYEREVLSRQNP